MMCNSGDERKLFSKKFGHQRKQGLGSRGKEGLLSVQSKRLDTRGVKIMQ